MRGILLTILLILAISSVSALSFTINGNPMEGIHELTAGEPFILGIVAEEGTIITDVEAKSSSPVFEVALEESLGGLTYEFVSTEDREIDIPPEMPGITAIVNVRVKYLTPSMESKELTQEFTVDLEKGEDAGFFSGLIKLLPEDAQLVIYNWLTNYTIPRMEPELKYEDLTKENLDALGIDVGEFSNQLREYKDEGDSEGLPTIEKIHDDLVEPEPVEDYEAEGKNKPRVQIRKLVFEVTYGENTITKSKMIVSVIADDQFLPEGELIIDIPKEIAVSAGLIRTSDFPEILEDDPVLKWSMKNVPQNEVKDYSYTSDGDAQNFETLAEAANEKPGLIARILMVILK